MSEGREIDWEALRQRLEQDARALEEAAETAPERVQAVLRRRAEALAGRGARVEAAAEIDVLLFSAGGERFALPLPQLAGVVAAPEITRVPGSAAELRGVTNVRGAIWAVAELSRLLGGDTAPGVGPGSLVLLRHDVLQVGLWVETVEGVSRLAPTTLGTPPAAAGRPVRGVTPEGVQLLEAAALFSHPGIAPAGSGLEEGN